MYAIIKCGNRQYKVLAGERIRTERMKSAAGQEISFQEVLLVADGEKVLVGRPTVAGAAVTGIVEGEEKGEKLFPFKKKRRKNYRRRIGHRQIATTVRIKEILVK